MPSRGLDRRPFSAAKRPRKPFGDRRGVRLALELRPGVLAALAVNGFLPPKTRGLRRGVVTMIPDDPEEYLY